MNVRVSVEDLSWAEGRDQMLLFKGSTNSWQQSRWKVAASQESRCLRVGAEQFMPHAQTPRLFQIMWGGERAE